eukprot:g12917.t1
MEQIVSSEARAVDAGDVKTLKQKMLATLDQRCGKQTVSSHAAGSEAKETDRAGPLPPGESGNSGAKHTGRPCPLLERHYLPVQGQTEKPDGYVSGQLSLMQFNVLAAGLSGEASGWGGFSHTSPACLSYPLRGIRLLQEIVRFLPDVLCLQELDRFDFFARRLSELGYSGHWLPKRNSPCLHFEPGQPDGCAIFYQARLFDRCGDPSPLFYHTGGQVALLLTLQPKWAAGQRLVIATTHLKAEKSAKGETIRAKQLQELLDHVHELRNGSNAPDAVIVAGDFNAPAVEEKGSFPLCAYPLIHRHPARLTSAYASYPPAPSAAAAAAAATTATTTTTTTTTTTAAAAAAATTTTAAVLPTARRGQKVAEKRLSMDWTEPVRFELGLEKFTRTPLQMERHSACKLEFVSAAGPTRGQASLIW